MSKKGADAMDIDPPQKLIKKNKDSDSKAEQKADATTKAPPKKSLHEILMDELRESISLIEKGVQSNDASFITRALMRQNALRKKVTVGTFLMAVDEALLPDNNASQFIHKYLDSLKDLEPQTAVPMEVENHKPAPVPEKPKLAPPPAAAEKSKTSLSSQPAVSVSKVDEKTTVSSGTVTVPSSSPPPTPRVNPLPELEMYLRLFTVILLIDRKKHQEAADAVTQLLPKITSLNRRTLDHISAKLYYYYALAYELIGRLAEIRPNLLAAHRTACLHHDEPSQANLTNAILRNFLYYNLYAQADKFRLNTKLPDSRSTTQHARYLYYRGAINSVQLHYGEAYADLTQAIRKAPMTGAIGFRQAAEKLRIIVQLLMGEIPERTIFRNPILRRSLKPYFQLTRAVRVGDLKLFNQVMTEFRSIFLKDKTISLVERLHHNVIKTGLRNINLSYSRISIKDICSKLHLASEEDAEYIIAKAIGDGVIDAVIDRANKSVFSKENIDIYSTQEPQLTLHKRISFCMEIHNGAVKSLRFPETAIKAKVATANGDDDPEPLED